MKIITYKSGEYIFSSSNKNNNNNYIQFYTRGELMYKGYRNKNYKRIGYREEYRHWLTKGINYVI
jgi:hypothetical protein